MNGPAGFEHAQIAPVPRVSLHAFCESPDTARIIQAAATDRRMERAHVSVHMGGPLAAVEAYRDAATPNVVLLDTAASRSDLLAHLEALAEFCDSGTKVVIAGRTNDIVLYRELMARGISDYLVAPLNVLDFIRAISHLYTSAGATPVGKIVAITGAKGGTGASSIAHNIAFSVARDLDIQTVTVDMDLGFGTAGLDFNQEPAQGIAEAVFAPDRIDQNLVDRLLSKCGDKLSILAAPATLDRMYDFPETAFDSLIDILRATTPCVILDIPHIWTAWARRALINADEIAIVASPDLANLRNTKKHARYAARGARPRWSSEADHELRWNSEKAGNQCRRFCQGGRSCAGGNHCFRAKALRHGGQQWADDRRSRCGGQNRWHDQGSRAKNYAPGRAA
jgi:pilus assembly protein CpaE